MLILPEIGLPITTLQQHHQDCVSFFRSGTRPTHDHMISYIDGYKDQFGVEAICRVIKQADRGFITSRATAKPPHALPVQQP